MDWRTWLLLLCMSYLCLSLANKAPETVTDVDGYTIFLCPDGYSFEQGVQAKMCPIGECDNQGDVCSPDDPSTNICTSPHPYLPDSALSSEIAKTASDATVPNVSKKYYATYSNCPAGTKWASGQVEPYLSTCSNSLWSPFYDICVKIGDEILPTDCSEMIPLGINELKWYHIYKLGLSENGPIKVFCEFAEDGNLTNSGWTTIFFGMNLSNSGDELDFEAVDTGSLFRNNLEDEGQFYTGIENQYILHQNVSGAPRTLVYQFLMIAETGFQHATYDDVNIGDNFVLETVGQYHGNAGDAFRNNVGKQYQSSSNNTLFGWFVEPTTDKMTILTDQDLIWGEMNQPNLLRAQIRVRPKDYDDEHTCPLLLPLPAVGTNDSWIGTNVSISQYRGPGSTIAYTCTGGNMYEGVEGQERTSEGTVSCKSVDTGRPEWNSSFILPCTIVCPDGYTEVGIPPKCYKVSSEGDPRGYFGAARSCAKDGATLAANPNASLLYSNNLMGVGFHFTAHAKRGPALIVTPELTFECNDTCQPTSVQECLVVNEVGKWESRSCYNTNLKHICVSPGICPDGYTMYNKRCLKIYDASEDSTLYSFQSCQADGAAFIVPETMEDVLLIQMG